MRSIPVGTASVSTACSCCLDWHRRRRHRHNPLRRRGPPPVPRPAAVPRITTAAIKQMKYPPLRPIQIPHVDITTLPNGMKLYLLEDHELPVVSGTALVRTGNLFDPADKIGLADHDRHGAAHGRHQGPRPATSWMKSWRTSPPRSKAVSARPMARCASPRSRKTPDEVLAIFNDVLLNPEFRQDKIDLAKTQLRSGISRRNDEAARHPAARILRHRLRPEYAVWLANGICHGRPHHARTT